MFSDQTQGIDTVLASYREEFDSLEHLARTALVQVDDEAFFRPLDGDANSLALLVKHIGGNLRSRWTDPFSTDGEKPDRDRDGEFLLEAGDTRDALMARWNAGWAALRATFSEATAADIDRVLTIRGQAHSFARALARSLAHTSGHVHQIVMLCRHWAGAGWSTPSIPRGQSTHFRPGEPAPPRG